MNTYELTYCRTVSQKLTVYINASSEAEALSKLDDGDYSITDGQCRELGVIASSEPEVKLVMRGNINE